MLMAISQPATQSQIYSMDCTSYCNENNLCVCYMDGNQHLVICFLKDKVSNTAGDGIAIGSNIVILHNHDQVQLMVLVVCMQYQINLLNQEMI